MKTLLLASTITAALASAAVPAAAQYAGFTGDGIFGREYRTETVRQPSGERLAVGYAEETVPETTGSVRAVTSTDRELDAAKDRPATPAKPDNLRR